MDVRFEDVEFVGNGNGDGRFRGGAVRAAACSNATCPRLALRFVSCRFAQNSAAFGGGVFVSAKNATIRIRNCTFEGNTADVAGGALFVRDAALTIRASRFEGNRAFGNTESDERRDQNTDDAQDPAQIEAGVAGGAIRAVNPLRIRILSSNFTGNVGCEGGGALSVSSAKLPQDIGDSNVFNIIASRFVNNSAFCGPQPKALENHDDGQQEHVGGALMYEALELTTAVWTIRNTTFQRNIAFKGGAVGFYSAVTSTAEHNITGSHFSENVAMVIGGSLFLCRLRLTIQSSLFRNSRSTYGGGIAVFRTGRLKFDDDPRSAAPVSVVEGNTGSYGGGIIVLYQSEHPRSLDLGSHILLFFTGQVNATALILRSNTALRSGGGMRIQECSGPIILRGVEVLNNWAVVGGGVSMLGVSILKVTSSEVADTVFGNNIAAVGGGFLFEPGEEIRFELLVSTQSFMPPCTERTALD